jgi:excisionase family DNA binding protein
MEGGIAASFLTARELAERLRISPAAVLRWAARGDVPSFKFPGGAVRFDPAAIDAWLAGRARGAGEGTEECHHPEPPPAPRGSL